MGGFQIATVVLLSVVTVVQVVGAAILYRSIVRRDEAATALKSAMATLLERVAGTEAALNNTNPAIERSTADAARFAAETNALLKGLGQTCLDLLSETRQILARLHTSVDHGSVIANEVRQVGPKLAAHADQRAELAKLLEGVGTRVGDVHQALAKMQSTMDVASTTSDQATADTHSRLDKVVAEVEKLRAAFGEATRF